MKIDINQMPPEELTLVEEFNPTNLDLETDIIKFHGPIKARADTSKIVNTVTVNLQLEALIYSNCSRCLEEFETNFKKNVMLNYQADKREPVIELEPEIREEIIIDYPIKPLCRQDCKGLCPKCGKNLNQGGCSCAST